MKRTTTRMMRKKSLNRRIQSIRLRKPTRNSLRRIKAALRNSKIRTNKRQRLLKSHQRSNAFKRRENRSKNKMIDVIFTFRMFPLLFFKVKFKITTQQSMIRINYARKSVDEFSVSSLEKGHKFSFAAHSTLLLACNFLFNLCYDRHHHFHELLK